MISMVMINWGEMGVDYNFGELLPGCDSRPGRRRRPTPTATPTTASRRIAGVQIDLLDG